MGEFPNRATQFKPGVAPNPEGRNQFTYQNEALAEFTKQLKQKLKPGTSRLSAAIDRVIEDCINGGHQAQKLVFERILPAVTRHEVDLGESTPLDAFIQSLGAFPSSRGNGKDLEAEPSGPKKGNGSSP